MTTTSDRPGARYQWIFVRLGNIRKSTQPAADRGGRGHQPPDAHLPREMALEFWRRLADPALEQYERLFFELYGPALGGQSSVTPVLDGLVTSWLIDDSVFAGLPAAHVRMVLAFSRGALLDLLATGDRAGVDAAVHAFIDLVWPED